jgi:hypothetical protein
MLKRRRHSHIFEPASNGFYVEPIAVPRALFAVEEFDRGQVLLDPCAGLGTIVSAAREAGYQAEAADIVDRGFPGTRVQDFFRRRRAPASVVCNPDFPIAREIVEHALKIGARKVAILFPIARICAVKASWIYTTPLRRMFAIGPRPSMPPGNILLAGEKPHGGRVDFAWLVFEAGYAGPAEIRHLITRTEG